MQGDAVGLIGGIKSIVIFVQHYDFFKGLSEFSEINVLLGLPV